MNGCVRLSLLLVALALGCSRSPVETPVASSAGQFPQRIISTAPSLTEMLFAMGLGDRVVGVTRYCRNPAEAQTLAIIGGHLDPNFEAILALRPDLVVVFNENNSTHETLGQLGVPTLLVGHQSISEILTTMETIGKHCGAGEEANRRVAKMRERLERIRERTEALDRPRVLISVQRTLGVDRLEDVYAAGQEGLFSEALQTAGGTNALANVWTQYPILPIEGILETDPQVIIDIIPRIDGQEADLDAALRDWRQVASVAAVREDRVHILHDDYAYIPGPRFVRFVEELARLLHPEVDWDE